MKDHGSSVAACRPSRILLQRVEEEAHLAEPRGLRHDDIQRRVPPTIALRAVHGKHPFTVQSSLVGGWCAPAARSISD
ncbi:hypothetical protein AOX55_00001127 [Sinorhizobium fredii CCBAU 25509]|nr:hypothetical protein AOX55_00001127 [Sinorhizobium fredii CCBAU 25509]